MKFKQIQLGNDIPKYLDEVEAEAIRILETNNLPTDPANLSVKNIYETITGKKLIDTLRLSPDSNFTYKMPILISQARGVLIQVAAARYQRKESEIHDEFTGIARDYMALSVAEIGMIINSSSARGAEGGAKNKGKEKAFTRYMKDIVSKLPDDMSGNKFDNVINLIRIHLETKEIEIEEIEEDRKGVVTGIQYYDVKAKKFHKASRRTLENHIYKK